MVVTVVSSEEDGTIADARDSGVFLGELEDTGDSQVATAVLHGGCSKGSETEVERLVCGWVLGSGAQGWDLSRAQAVIR